MDYSFLDTNKIVPVVVINNLEDTDEIIGNLEKGGIMSAEITFRTACAKEAIKRASKNFPNMLVGAGTVINVDQCNDAIDAGAKFIVSPGLNLDVAKVCVDRNVPYLPGVATPTEIIAAVNFGLTVLKFFPAGVYGGAKALKALSAAFPQVRFLPTGGVDEKNMKDFFALKCVAAIGGSFMFKGTNDEIVDKCKAALDQLKEM